MSKTTTINVEIPSFDSLIETYADEKKLEVAKRKTLKIKKEAKLSSLVKQAKIALIDAESGLTEALFSENADEANAVKKVVEAKQTHEFYEAIYNALFPNA